MEKNILSNLNKILLSSMGESYPLGLAHGEMGLSIYFYYLYKFEKSEEFKLVAEKLLTGVLNNLPFDYTISVENGLAGIALGVTHLTEIGFVEGDVNELLEDIDNVVFKCLAFLQPNSSYKKEELLHLIYYLSVRLSDQKDEENSYIFSELIIKVINIFAHGLSDNFFDESFSFSVCQYHLPLFTYVCARLLKQGFYSDRIYKILEEFEPKVLSQIPILHSNRLYLLCGMLPLVSYMQNLHWKNHVNLLQKEINLQVILEEEMKNKHIFLSNGLSMIYLFLHYLKENYPDYKIAYDPQNFYDRIIASEAWDSLLKRDYFFNIHCGLLTGFPGVRLILSHIQKQNI